MLFTVRKRKCPHSTADMLDLAALDAEFVAEVNASMHAMQAGKVREVDGDAVSANLLYAIAEEHEVQAREIQAEIHDLVKLMLADGPVTAFPVAEMLFTMAGA